MLEGAKHITLISFSQFSNWDAKFYLGNTKALSSGAFPLVSFGQFAKKAEIQKVKIEDSKEYKILGVRSYGMGAYHNRTSKGRDLKMKVYQQAKLNHLFWCKVDTKNGAFGIITEGLKTGLGSSNMTFAELDLSMIDVNYLQILFKSPKLHQYMDNMVTGTTNRKYIKFSELLSNVKIPLPTTIEEQNKLVADYNKKMALAARQESQALTKEQEIEEYIFDKLDITLAEQLEIKGLQMVSFKDIDSWSVERLFKQEGNSELKSGIYSNVKLSTILKINPTTDIKALDNADAMSFIPMECVSDIYGEIKEVRDGVKLKSKGYTKFQNGDLIWARITPCMQNGKSALVDNLANGVGYGSTEYHVLRDVSGKVNMSYIHIILRLEAVLKNAMSHFTGSAGQQRVPKYFLESLSIPLPPIEIQNEIATHISGLKQEIKKLRTTAEANRKAALANFEQKIF